MEQQAPFDIVGVSVSCHGNPLLLTASSPGICRICGGILTIENLNVNYNLPPRIATPHIQVPGDLRGN